MNGNLNQEEIMKLNKFETSSTVIEFNIFKLLSIKKHKYFMKWSNSNGNWSGYFFDNGILDENTIKCIDKCRR